MNSSVLNLSLWPALFAFFSTVLAIYVIAEVVVFIVARYRERYLDEASAGLDDVFIQLPASRVFELSLALSIIGSLLTVVLSIVFLKEVSWQWTIFIGFVIGAALFPVPLLILRVLRTRRLNKFNVQLEDALTMVSSSLKAGFSITQALDEIANLDVRPISLEFRLLIQEVQLGVPLDKALDNMSDRLHSDDFELVSMAIQTARQTGGELTTALERVATLVRERVRISNKVRATTAMGRLQALIIGAMPFCLLFGLYMINAPMVEGFVRTGLGMVALFLVVILDICAFLVIRKITNIEV